MAVSNSRSWSPLLTVQSLLGKIKGREKFDKKEGVLFFVYNGHG